MYSTFRKYADLRNVEGLEYKIIKNLIDLEIPEAEDFWKLLYYSDERALLQPNLSKKQKYGMIETAMSTSSSMADSKQVIIAPYLDYALTEAGSKIFIYCSAFTPQRTGTLLNVNVTVDIICNAKSALIMGKGTGDDINVNPNDFDEDGIIRVQRENRITALTVKLISLLNGMANLDLSGILSLDNSSDYHSKSTSELFNGRSCYGSETVFTIPLAQVDSDC